MAIQPPEGNIQSESQCNMITESKGEPLQALKHGKVGWNDQQVEPCDQLLVSNPYTVLADDDIGNQPNNIIHDKILPIKALGAYPIQDHE